MLARYVSVASEVPIAADGPGVARQNGLHHFFRSLLTFPCPSRPFLSAHCHLRLFALWVHNAVEALLIPTVPVHDASETRSAQQLLLDPPGLWFAGALKILSLTS